MPDEHEAVSTQPGISMSDVDAEGFIVDEVTDEVLRLRLDLFEGPLDVLLYLIKSQELDIFDIPIATITDQYIRFIEVLREDNLEVAGDFLVMAATLIQIKSKMLLPADMDTEDDAEGEDEDPRLELVEKLIEYRKFRDVAERLTELEEERSRWFSRNVKPVIEGGDVVEEYVDVSLYDLIDAFKGVLRFMSDDLFHQIEGEAHSVDGKIEYIESSMAEHGSIGWTDLFKSCRSKVELVCCFLAILELCRMGRLRAHQHHSFEEIRLFPRDDTAEHADVVPA